MNYDLVEYTLSVAYAFLPFSISVILPISALSGRK